MSDYGRRRAGRRTLTEASRSRRSGRLELTWTNKDWRLLAREDGTWDWVPPSDYRIAEVRLLHEAATVGDAYEEPESLLIRGDALNALTALNEIPDYAECFAGGVQLAYLDPPFNTQQSFLQYDDALEHSLWLTMLRDRLEQVQKLLDPDGSVWVHLDDSEVHRCRLLLDEVFGADCFVGTVIWEKADSPRMDAKHFSTRHDYLLVYGVEPDPDIHGLTYEPEHYDQVDAEGRSYYLKPLRAMAGEASTREARPNLYFSLNAPDDTEIWPKLPDGRDGRWRWSQERVERDRDLIEWKHARRGWQPYYRIYARDEATRPPETIWLSTDVGSNRTSKAEVKRLLPDMPPFATPKPEALLARVIEIASRRGDLVLDCFVGSGTTAAVAHKLGRRWIAVERSVEVVDQYALPRLTQVVRGEDRGGVTPTAGWEGGGGFRVLQVGPSMFNDDEGQIVLADWAVNGALAEATAAQLHFPYRPESPFSGRRGRTRLAVIDGHVSQAVVQLLLDQLEGRELLVVCGTSLDPLAGEELRQARPGSRARKIPDSLLAEYQKTHRWRPGSVEVLRSGEGTVVPAAAAEHAQAAPEKVPN